MMGFGWFYLYDIFENFKLIFLELQI